MSHLPVKKTEEPSVVINLRAPARQRHLVDQAAKALGKTRTEFILDAACRAAEEALLDQRFFQIDADAFDRFTAMLDAPVSPDPRLRALLSRKAPWEV